MSNSRNAFGIAQTRTVTIRLESLDLQQLVLLGLQPSQPKWEWLGLLHKATNLAFRNTMPLQYTDSDYTFETFAASRPYLPMIIRNRSTEGNKLLLGYHSSALHRINHARGKVLPNQLSLFPEEAIAPTLDMDDPKYLKNNPDDLIQWNRLVGYLSCQAVPLEEFSYLLPFQYEEYVSYLPLLNHLRRVEGLQYRFIAGHELGDDQLFYSLFAYQSKLRRHYFDSSGRYSSKERSS